jgi:acyl-coenzyme A thioesterase PaaI-like protein
MQEFTPKNPSFEQTVRDFVLSMPVAKFYGFYFGQILPGYVETIQPYRKELGHQDGFFQAGVIGAVADFAGAPAALTLLAPGWSGATVDFTVKIIAAARGDRLVARGRVMRPGGLLTVSCVDVYACMGAEETLCACAFVSVRNFQIEKE